jgi:RNA polymerase sigma factor (sigma-70 family)
MASNPLHTVLDHLRRLHSVSSAAQRTDRELLRTFAHNNDQDAFAIVVTRHAPLVWGVCRRILGNHQDAEDAFQATFLILARRAGSARWQASIGGWLHMVAQRLAMRVRKQIEKQRIHEREASRTPPVDTSLRELAAVVDEELRRLPVKYREPLLLHYLEGATAEAAARQLGLSRTTFYNRLAYGRELLRERLSRQGLSLTAPLLAAALTAEAEAASQPLIQTTVRGVMGKVSERVAALAAEMLARTAMMKLKISLALGLLLGLSAGGVAMLTPSAPMDAVPQAERPAEPSKAEDKAAVRVDRYGDPLPQGAIARLGTRRWRASDNVATLAFTPDGQTVLTVSPAENSLADSPPANGLCLFDIVTGKRIKSIRLPGTFFGRIALSADGKRLAAACTLWPDEDRRKTVVQILELSSGRKLQEFDVGKLDVEDLLWLGWSADDHPLAANLGKGEMILHDLATGRERRFPAKDLPEPRRNWVCKCVVGKNILAASDEKGSIHLWNLADGKKRYVLKSGDSVVHSLALSANGRLLASLAPGSAGVRLWNTATGEAVPRIATEQKWMDGVVFSSDSKVLATVGWSEVCFWDAATGRALGRTKGEGRSFGPAIAFSPDGKTLAASERYSSAIHLWDVPSGTMKPQAEGHTNRPHIPAFSPDGKRVATSSPMDGTIFIWNPATGEPRFRIHQRDEAGVCAFSADGRTLYSLHDNRLIFFDASNGRELHVLKMEDPQHRPKMSPFGMGLHLSDDGARLIVVSDLNDNNAYSKNEMLVSGWDTSTRKQLFQYTHAGREFGYAFSMGDRLLAAHPSRSRVDVQASGPMRLEDAQTGELWFTFPALEGQTWPLSFSPDGRLLASNNVNGERKGKKDDPAGATRNALHLWETASACEVLTLPLEDPLQIAFSPDGRVLALTAPGGDLVLWDLKRGKEFRRFKGFDAQVNSLAFSPDGRRLVSGLSDSTLLVWDVAAPSTTPVEKPPAEGAAKAWADLAYADAKRAFRARWMLASAPNESISLLKERLRPAKAADPQRLRRLLADLDSDQFAVREKAQEKLIQLGDLAEPALRQTLANNPSLEMRKRMQAILARLRGPVKQPELLQALRAVAVLEDIASPEARRLLQELTKGTPASRLTREATASLERLTACRPMAKR